MMKLKLYRTLLFCVSSALVAGPAFAQQDTTPRPTTPTTPQPGESSSSGQYGHRAMMHGQAIRASKINGAQVKTATGDTLGTIEDFLINPQTGQIEFAVLSVTGATGTTPTGVGEKLTPIPWKLLSASTAPGRLGTEMPSFTANVDKEKLTAAPNFDKNQWPDFGRGWNQRIYSYYGVTPDTGAGGTGTGLDKGGTGPGTE